MATKRGAPSEDLRPDPVKRVKTSSEVQDNLIETFANVGAHQFRKNMGTRYTKKRLLQFMKDLKIETNTYTLSPLKTKKDRKPDMLDTIVDDLALRSIPHWSKWYVLLFIVNLF